VLDRHLSLVTAEHRRRRDAMVRALREHVPAAHLRFTVPDGGMYLWCQLPPTIRARAVQEQALRESVMILTGDPFYVDQGGDHQLRICYTSQPASRAEQIAKTLARSLAAAQRAGAEPPPAVRLV
jgi:2-aminoadipate transaminase